MPKTSKRRVAHDPPWRGATLLLLTSFALVAACTGATREELLAGKACDTSGACAPGYVCDTPSNICVLEGGVTTSSSTGGGMGGTGAGGEGGGPTGCTSPSECPPPQTPCEVPICVGNLCGYSALPMGTNVAMQVSGDCKRAICDGQGNIIDSTDAGDLPVDGNSCTDDVCNGSEAENPPVDLGTACEMDKQCDGEGSCVSCLVPADCTSLPASNECRQRACTAGACGETFTASGTAISTQTPGDCMRTECDGAGSTTVAVDDLDVPDDANPCTLDVCTAGTPSNPDAPSNTPCGQGLTCDGAGNCTGCNVPTDCGTDSFCVQYTCNAGSCGINYTTAGTPLPTVSQTAGDCQQLQCNGNGVVESVALDTDVPADDNNDCTVEGCQLGIPQLDPQPLNTACTNGGGAVCDGQGACVQCNSASQCTNQGGICETATCTTGTCGLQPIPNGTAAPSAAQSTGDCKAVLCDGAGGTTLQNDNVDLPVDNNDCTLDVCTAGVPSNPDASAGTSCAMGAGTCDGSGNCSTASLPLGSPCSGPGSCQSGNCVDGVCCGSACTGMCQACSAAFTGMSDGTCANIVAGQDPQNECGTNDTCNGSGSCAFLCGQEPLPPPIMCPAACTGGCAGGVCLIDCNGPASCTGDMLSCPPGLACEVQCGDATSCDNATISCPDKYACNVVCSGDCKGATVQCGGGTCDMVCGSGTQCSGATMTCGGNRCTSTCAGGAFPTVTCNGSCDCNDCRLPAGASCADDAHCLSDHCPADDGVCCDVACNGACEACTAAKTGGTTGMCSDVLGGTDPENECQGQQTCDGAGQCGLKPAGAPCNNGSQCQSGICPPSDGVCCSTACSGLCEACSAAATGGTDGICSPVLPGTDPNNECPGPQTCNGTGSCQN